jgi:hypothetical protein
VSAAMLRTSARRGGISTRLLVDGEVGGLTALRDLVRSKQHGPRQRQAEQGDEGAGGSDIGRQCRIGEATLQLAAAHLFAWQIAGGAA